MDLNFLRPEWRKMLAFFGLLRQVKLVKGGLTKSYLKPFK